MIQIEEEKISEMSTKETVQEKEKNTKQTNPGEMDDDMIWTPIGIFSKSEQRRRASLSTSSHKGTARKSVCQGLLDMDGIDMDALRKKADLQKNTSS